MRWWVYKHSNSISIELDNEELLEKFILNIKDMIKSAVFHDDYSSAKDYIELLQEVEAAYKELIKTNEEVTEE